MGRHAGPLACLRWKHCGTNRCVPHTVRVDTSACAVAIAEFGPPGLQTGVLGDRSALVAKDLPIPGEHSPLHWQYSSEVPPSAYFNADAWAMPHPTAIRSALEELADGSGGLADALVGFS